MKGAFHLINMPGSATSQAWAILTIMLWTTTDRHVQDTMEEFNVIPMAEQWQWILNLTLAHLTSHEFRLSNFHVCMRLLRRGDYLHCNHQPCPPSCHSHCCLITWNDLGPSDWSVTHTYIIMLLYIIVRIYSIVINYVYYRKRALKLNRQICIRICWCFWRMERLRSCGSWSMANRFSNSQEHLRHLSPWLLFLHCFSSWIETMLQRSSWPTNFWNNIRWTLRWKLRLPNKTIAKQLLIQ